MHNLPTLSILTLFILFISVFFAVFLFTVKTKNRLRNTLIALYLLVMAFHISTFFYGYYFQTVPLIFDMIRDQIVYLSHPLLYLYILSSIYDDFRLRYNHLFHLLPFLLIIGVFTPNFYLLDISGQIMFYENFLNNTETRFSSLFGFGVVFFYLSLIFIELRKYRKILLENFSSVRNFNYKWLFQIAVMVSVIYIFAVYKTIYRYSGEDVMVTHQLRIIITLILFGFMSWVVLKGLYHPELFRGISKNLKSVKQLVTIGKKQGFTITATSQEIDVLQRIAQLKKYMKDHKPFLDSSLTIQELAKGMNMPVKDLSILINHNLNQHFYDFINGYRIREAMIILENPMCHKRTILEILYEVGINTKSSFNSAFKKYAQMTPTSYRKTNSESIIARN